MNATQQSRLVAHGALVFLLGLAAGFPFAFEILGRLELWPIPGSVPVDMPGDVRGWRMAHLEGILNGLVLIAVGAVGNHLRLGPRGVAWVVYGLLVCAWGNIVASWIGPLTETRGLAFTAGWNGLVYLLFVAAIIGGVGAMLMVFVGARAAMRATTVPRAPAATPSPDSRSS